MANAREKISSWLVKSNVSEGVRIASRDTSSALRVIAKASGVVKCVFGCGEEIMTIFDKESGPQRPQVFNRFGQSFGSRSTGRLVFFAVMTLLALLLIGNFVVSVTRIEAGYTGIEVNLAGSQRGASQIPIRTGWVVFSPLTTQIIEFPTFVQTVKWTKDVSEGHPINEEMGFNSKEGMEVFVDTSLSYAIEPTKVPDFYVKYRVNNLELFTHGILRDIVRNSLNEVASTYTVEDIYGEKKAQFLRQVEQQIQDKVTNVGVGVQQFGFIGAPRVPAVIATAITAKAQAIQESERAKNELATTQAEAAKKIAEAEGDAKSVVTRAQGEADANRIRQSSISPQLLELRRLENQRAYIDKWNGQLPSVEAGQGTGLLLQLPKGQ
jgi:regulator of protease activity HflC (stomatin/prohibitin superfamily)